METGLIKKDTINNIVTKYQKSIEEIQAAYVLLERAHDQLGTITNYYNVFPSNVCIYNGFEKIRDEVCQKIKSRVWRKIFDMTQSGELMTAKRKKEFDDAIEKPETLPEITRETILDFVNNLHDSVPDMLMEFIKETFDFLKPSKYSSDKYKTNAKSKYELQEKIIKTWVLGFGGINYNMEKNIQSMDNAFSMIDGKGITKYPGNTLTMIREAIQNNENKVETEYFQFRWYNNGNLHIKFKRMDLVSKINQIAGESLLKP